MLLSGSISQQTASRAAPRGGRGLNTRFLSRGRAGRGGEGGTAQTFVPLGSSRHIPPGRPGRPGRAIGRGDVSLRPRAAPHAVPAPPGLWARVWGSRPGPRPAALGAPASPQRGRLCRLCASILSGGFGTGVGGSEPGPPPRGARPEPRRPFPHREPRAQPQRPGRLGCFVRPGARDPALRRPRGAQPWNRRWQALPAGTQTAFYASVCAPRANPIPKSTCRKGGVLIRKGAVFRKNEVACHSPGGPAGKTDYRAPVPKPRPKAPQASGCRGLFASEKRHVGDSLRFLCFLGLGLQTRIRSALKEGA